MTLLLTESEVAKYVSMEEVVPAVEEAFRREARSEAVNSPRTRSASPGAVLSVMHASLPYLGRSGTKVYTSSRSGNNFVFLLFENRSGELLAIMGADTLGAYRTGAASAVATKFLCPLRRFRLAIAGSGHQALTQVLAMREVAEVEHVSVWSPTLSHRELFAKRLSRDYGLEATSHRSIGEAFQKSQVATAITSADRAFIGRSVVRGVSHINACGANSHDKAEVTPAALATCSTICVDNLKQSMLESGDLIIAARKGAISWERVVELKDVVSSRVKPRGRTYFKSNGVAIEDVAIGSLVYDKAVKNGGRQDFGFRTKG